MKVPIGVIILSVFALVAGVVGIFRGFVLMDVVLFGPQKFGSGIFLVGAFALIVGLIWLAVAFAAWRLEPWAWLFGWLMCIFGLIDAVFVLLGTGNLGAGLAAALFPAVILWYLNQPHIRAQFGQDR
jgi:hypothetical protein